MSRKFEKIETRIIHAGEPDPRIHGAVSMPVFQSSTFEYSGQKKYDDLRYIRLNNTPNHIVLHAKLADLEGGQAAVVTASGMAAITTVLLTLLRQGDHLLAQRGLYGGTHHFVTHDLQDFGIACDLVNGRNPDSWKDKLQPTTRVMYVETIANPLMEVCDLRAVADFCKRNGLISVIDNTFASPLNFRPLEWGFDVSVHSATKYLNGHSDIVAGAVIGSGELIGRVVSRLNHLGGTLDPHACFLLHRGLKTLALRMRAQNESALKIARFLARHEGVETVNYPGLEDHPDHERARELFSGFGGMLSFELEGGAEHCDKFLSLLRLPLVAPSLGGVETLITRPSTTSHVGMGKEERRKLGISEGLIRLSVGIEATEEIIEDLSQALQGVSESSSTVSA